MVTDKPFKLNVITICGSMKFWDDILKEGERLELEGNVIILPFPISKLENKESIYCEQNKIKLLLSTIHRSKIDMCNEVYIVNKNGYIGKATKQEIDYAISVGKKVSYMEPID